MIFTEPAETELDRAYQWMLSFGFDVAERWLKGIQALVDREAEIQSILPLRRPIAPDSSPDRPLQTLLYRTRGRGSSTWHILFEIADSSNELAPSNLCVVRIRHARSR